MTVRELAQLRRVRRGDLADAGCSADGEAADGQVTGPAGLVSGNAVRRGRDVREIRLGCGRGNVQLTGWRRSGWSAGSALVSVGLALLVLLGSAILPPSRPARAEISVLDTVNVSTNPESLAVDPVTNRIFVVNT